MRSIGVWSINHAIPTSLELCMGLQCKGGPICPSTAYQGAKTLCIHIIWMWNALHGGFEPQPWHYNITRAQVYPNIPKIHPQPAQALQCESGPPICPSIAYQGAKTLCMHIIWMWNALHGGFEHQPWHYNITGLRSTYLCKPNFWSAEINFRRELLTKSGLKLIVSKLCYLTFDTIYFVA